MINLDYLVEKIPNSLQNKKFGFNGELVSNPYMLKSLVVLSKWFYKNVSSFLSDDERGKKIISEGPEGIVSMFMEDLRQYETGQKVKLKNLVLDTLATLNLAPYLQGWSKRLNFWGEEGAPMRCC